MFKFSYELRTLMLYKSPRICEFIMSAPYSLNTNAFLLGLDGFVLVYLDAMVHAVGNGKLAFGQQGQTPWTT